MLYLIQLLVALAVCPSISDARSLIEIQQTGELRACLAPIHPSIVQVDPAGCRDECRFTGAVYEEVLAFVASLAGDIKPRFRRVDWDEQFHDANGQTLYEASYTPELLASGYCDLYPSNLTITDWRLNKLDIVPLFKSRMMVIVQKDKRQQFNTPADLAGKEVAAAIDTSFYTWLQTQNQTTYAANPVKIKLVGIGDALAAVDARLVDFAITDADGAIWSVRHQFKNATVAFPVGPVDEIGWAFSKADQDLQTAVKQFFCRTKSA